jgi:hypothetical protein
MLNANIHPWFRERIKKVGERRQRDNLDLQAGVSCQLGQAAIRLRRAQGRVADFAGAGGTQSKQEKVRVLCAGAARKVRQQALKASTGEARLLAIYAEIESLTESLNRVQDGGRLPRGRVRQ